MFTRVLTALSLVALLAISASAQAGTFSANTHIQSTLLTQHVG